MGTVVGLTAARMLAIEAACIVDGAVVLNDLVLTTHDGTEINAGNVRGPQGAQGIPGDQTPVGAIVMFGGSVAPTNWHICDGSSQLRAGAFSALFSAIGILYGYEDGTHFNLPDLRGRIPVGVGSHTDVAYLGNNDGVALASRRIKHAHTVSDPGHVHGIFDPYHNHGIFDPGHDHQQIFGQAATGGGVSRPEVSANRQLFGDADTNPSTTGIIVSAAPTGITINSDPTGISVGVPNAPVEGPAYLTVNYIIKY